MSEAAPGEERKVATVLFADLVGSTELGEQDPERTRALLDRFYDAMATEIARAGGTLEKFAGDAVMAVFGAPTAQEDHAERALHAALAMCRRLRELFDGRLEMRVGVNTGEVVVGRPREGSSFVTGDAVNVAARLEQNGEPGEILVGERTVADVRGAFEFDEPRRIEAKGKRDAVVCRRLVRALSLMRPRGVGGLARAFVGRAEELEALQATYRGVAERRRPELVTVAGDAGVGKTTLVREFWQWLADQTPAPLLRTGRCLSYGRGITFWPLAEILKEHFGILETDSSEIVERRLADRPMLGLSLGLEVAGDLHPRAARDRFQDAWAEFVDELTNEQPVVMLIEDVHLAEEPLFDLLELLLATVTGPLLLLVSARPELFDRRPAWGVRAGGRRVELEALSPPDAAEMVRALLANDVPAGLEDVVVSQAEGNPFFVEELLATFIDLDLLRPANGGWTLRELPADFRVPDSIHTLLAARIDLLDLPEKAALQAASVIGRIFWTGPVYELLEGLDADLRVLEERDFIRRRAGSSMAGEREYAIKHALTREVAYASLPKAKRARMHAGFAAWLERLGRDRDELAPLLAHHYTQAVRPEDEDLAWAGQPEQAERLRSAAVTWLRRAAALAIGRYEMDEGVGLLRRALELRADAAEQAEIWRELGRAYALSFDGEAFWNAMQRSLEVCVDPPTCADSYSLLAFQTSIRSGMWKRRPESELVEGWISQALELSEPETPARARALIARAYWHPAAGGEAARDAVALASRLGDPELRSYAWMAQAAVEFRAWRFEGAAHWALRRFDLAEEISDPDHLAELRETALPAVLSLGRFREAGRLAREYVELARRLSPHHRLHGVSLLVETDELWGRWEAICELEPVVRQAVAENAETPCVRNARNLLVCAAARQYTGLEEQARELELVADELGMEGHGVALDGPRLRLALARRELETVARLIDRNAFRYVFGLPNLAARFDALAALGDRQRVEDEAPQLMRSGTYLEPFALRALGLVREDDELLARAQERFSALKLDWHAAQTTALSG